MCGIVGYIGNKNAQNFLLSGLKRLEYRGYDSAGIVTIAQDSRTTLLRTKGKIANLEAKVAKQKVNDSFGIGHTRWATHGEPSEKNAHPHQAGPLFLVHNGIIENYKELKSQLKSHHFKSDTDTEVLVALINSFYQDGKYPSPTPQSRPSNWSVAPMVSPLFPNSTLPKLSLLAQVHPLSSVLVVMKLSSPQTPPP